jgi:hypothetical protein
MTESEFWMRVYLCQMESENPEYDRSGLVMTAVETADAAIQELRARRKTLEGVWTDMKEYFPTLP